MLDYHLWKLSLLQASFTLLRDNPRVSSFQRGREEEEEMEKKVVWVSMAVGFLGILSAALGFAAEATRVKVMFHEFLLDFLFV